MAARGGVGADDRDVDCSKSCCCCCTASEKESSGKKRLFEPQSSTAFTSAFPNAIEKQSKENVRTSTYVLRYGVLESKTSSQVFPPLSPSCILNAWILLRPLSIMLVKLGQVLA